MAIIQKEYETIGERNEALNPIREQIDSIDDQITKLKDEAEEIAFNYGGVNSSNKVRKGTDAGRAKANNRLDEIKEALFELNRKRSGMKGVYYRIMGAKINKPVYHQNPEPIHEYE